MNELRCPSRLHGKFVGDDHRVLEFKCDSKRCGAGRGVVVLHRIDITTGELLTTERFRNPAP